MAIRKKGSRKIVVEEHEFRWVATGSDYGVGIVIWPIENKNAIIETAVGYYVSENNEKLIVTNRMIKAIILYVGVDKLLMASSRFNLGKVEDFFSVDQGVWQGKEKKTCPRCSRILGFDTVCQGG